jgi:hypothetical protein
MKFLIIFLSLITTINVWGNAKTECFLDPRLNSTSSESSAILCGNVITSTDLENVIECYFDERLNYSDSQVSALLCAKVKSKEDKNKVINCYKANTENLWVSVLNCI